MIEKPCLLDTDILSCILKEQAPVYHISQEYLKKHKAFTISCLSYYECLRGYKATGATKRLERFYRFLILTDVIYLDRAIFETASDIYGILKQHGTLPGDFDILIAATALVHDLIIVTNNEKHYRPIQVHFPVTIQNWMKRQETQDLSEQSEKPTEEQTQKDT